MARRLGLDSVSLTAVLFFVAAVLNMPAEVRAQHTVVSSSRVDPGAAAPTAISTHKDSEHLRRYTQHGSAALSASLSEESGADDIFLGASIGTGWPMASGFVVTNSHVVAGCRTIALLDQSGAKFTAWPVLRDDVNDIAVLQVAEPRKLPAALPLADTRTRLGSSVFTIGFPRIDVMGKGPKLSNGVISGLNGLRDDPCSYQTTVPIQPGNSGGPMFNMSGEVVGIVASMVGIRNDTSGTVSPLPNISCAVKIECLKELFPHLPAKAMGIDSLPSHPGDLESVAQRVQHSILIVVAR
jgi:S1-C subfamily serine protease